jgi:MOSC domain-containing protein YiiM
MESNLAMLLNTFAQTGSVNWIGLRPARERTVQAAEQVYADVQQGLAGDHYRSPGGSRQVTLIQAEHLPVIAALAGKTTVDPAALRRNIVVAGINLIALKGWRVAIGAALIEVTGHCHPCSRMEQALGAGGYNAMRGHGGVTARVVQSGEIRLGASVRAIAPIAKDQGGDSQAGDLFS